MQKAKEPVITYNLVLKSSVKGGSTEVELPCSPVPDTVKALKEEIEEQFSVPVAIQSLSYNGHSLVDNDGKLKIKAGDTVEVMECLEGGGRNRGP